MGDLSGKRILFAITKSNWGGAQSYVFTLARRAHAAGADVAVALGGTGRPGSDTGVLAERLTQEGIRLRILPSIGRDISFFEEWRALRELVGLIREERPDILHLNSSKAGALGSLAGRIARAPRIVFTAHGWPHREARGSLVRLFIWLASWATIVLSHAVIAVSDCDLRSAPVLFFRRKIRVIRNGIAPFAPLPREEARRFLAPAIPELLKLPRWILVNSELTRNKSIDTAIHAFAGVSQHIKDVALVIASEGEEREALQELIGSYRLEKRAFLLGFVPDAKRYLLAADIFLMPSRKEGLPLALLEAGFAGLPAIASRTGGIPEIIEDGKNGLLITPRDIDALADALTRLLSDQDEATRFGEELQKTVRAEFSEERMLAETATLYLKDGRPSGRRDS